jgi:hypothetical protein
VSPTNTTSRAGRTASVSRATAQKITGEPIFPHQVDAEHGGRPTEIREPFTWRTSTRTRGAVRTSQVMAVARPLFPARKGGRGLFQTRRSGSQVSFVIRGRLFLVPRIIRGYASTNQIVSQFRPVKPKKIGSTFLDDLLPSNRRK